MPITFDDSTHPNVLVTVSGPVSIDEYDGYHVGLAERMQLARTAGTQFGLIFDARESEPLSAVQRRRMAQFLEDQSALLKLTVTGQAVVLSNIMQRGVLTAIFWVRPSPVPHRVCATVDEGRLWLEALARSPV